jgi:2'-5' RNA ligase
LQRLTSDFDAFEVKTGGVGAFPSLKRVRVVWYGVKGGEERLTELAQAVEKSVEGLGFEAEGRFHPHITLGRVRRESNGLSLIWPEWAETSGKECLLRIDRFTLMQSILSGSGPTYSVVREFPLGMQAHLSVPVEGAGAGGN